MAENEVEIGKLVLPGENLPENEVQIGKLILPGESLPEVYEMSKKRKVVVGPGIKCYSTHCQAMVAGTLTHRPPNVFYISGFGCRYVPTRGDTVVGIIMNKSSDTFRVDINSFELVSLDYLAFEGVTKKNRPDLNVGDLVFARVLCSGPMYEAELVCVDSVGKQKRMGKLSDGGYVFDCMLNTCRELLNKNCTFLSELAKHFTYEIAVGLNGRIWVKAKSAKETMAIANAILDFEYTPGDKYKSLCQKAIDYAYGR